RSTVAYSPETLTEAAAVWERLSGFVERAVSAVGEIPEAEIASITAADLPEDFVAAMDDDLNVSAALAVIHETVTAGNNALSARDDLATTTAQREVRAMLDVLGLDPLAEPWRGTAATDKTHDALDALVTNVLEDRAAARASKDWARADALRDSLQAAGIAVEDSAEGANWHVEGR
ncbi:MAG: DALR domain-containing protein, partial [Ancrocorticia sp.]